MNSKIFTVTEVSEYIKYIFDKDYALNSICVQGEISNLKKHSSGNLYFTIKDTSSIINCIMFKDEADSLKFKIGNGFLAIVNGRISSYEKTSQYQLYINSIEPLGKGSLYLAFEQLKQKLSDAGMFNKAHKKQIPYYPEAVGIITSITGAAVRDIIQIAKRRNPNIQLVLIPVLVQGENAAKDIAKAIYLMNEWNKVDIIIIGRGGGSIEDLWAFNEEIVAKAIYNSNIPIISAVGHEIDYTITDFVADLRAPTPSAAAELAIPDLIETKIKIDSFNKRLTNGFVSNTSKYKTRLNQISNKLLLNDPSKQIHDLQNQIDRLKKDLNKSMQFYLQSNEAALVNIINKLETSSPLSILKKGYSICCKDNGQTILNVDNVYKGDILTVQLNDGYIVAKVEGKEKGIWHANNHLKKELSE